MANFKIVAIFLIFNFNLKNNCFFLVLYTHKTKDQVAWTSLKIEGELGCSEKVSSSCSTSGIHHVNLVTWITYNISVEGIFQSLWYLAVFP
jgi:hypothetical protein